MRKHNYLPSGRVLFDHDKSDTGDEDSTVFRKRIPHFPPKNNNKSLREQKIKEIENRTIQSAQRSLNILKETQDVGIIAAKDLVEQGEKLQNINMKLGDIDSNLKQSQKDINGIKSVIFGIKNYISGNSRSPSPHRRHASPKKQGQKLGQSKFYDTTDSPQRTVTTSETESPARSFQTQDLQPAGASSKVDSILEANLQEMAYQLTQLKELGIEFSKEIDHQNETIDTIQDKIERADIKIGKQNKAMNNILGK